MKTIKHTRVRQVSCRLLVILALVVVWLLPADAEIIPADRRITWEPGIPGGIPIRTTVFTNIKHPPFNAKGDGISDDTDAIQAAINACPSNQVVYFPAGVYVITNAIRMPLVTCTSISSSPSSILMALMPLERGFAYAESAVFLTVPFLVEKRSD